MMISQLRRGFSYARRALRSEGKKRGASVDERKPRLACQWDRWDPSHSMRHQLRQGTRDLKSADPAVDALCI